MRMKGKILKVSELKSSPNPYILDELFWSRERLTMYLEKMLKKPRGNRAGIPVKNILVMTIIRYKLADSL
jgi:hypothetical protein